MPNLPNFKRRISGRKEEAVKAKKVFNSDDINTLANKLGISSSGINDDKIKFELNKLKNKAALRKQLKLKDSDFTKYGL